MIIDLTAAAPWVACAIAIFSLYYTIYNNRSKDTSTKFETIDQKLETKASTVMVGALAGKVDLLEDKVIAIQSDLDHLPDKDITHRLELSIAEMRTDMRGLTERIKPIGAMVERLQDVLVETVRVERDRAE